MITTLNRRRFLLCIGAFLGFRKRSDADGVRALKRYRSIGDLVDAPGWFVTSGNAHLLFSSTCDQHIPVVWTNEFGKPICLTPNQSAALLRGEVVNYFDGAKEIAV